MLRYKIIAEPTKCVCVCVRAWFSLFLKNREKKKPNKFWQYNIIYIRVTETHTTMLV